MRNPGFGANQGTFLAQGGKPIAFGIGVAEGWRRKYRLTILFAATAVLVITIATVAVNHVIGNLAESNLIRSAEENTIRDAEHIQAMLRSGHTMGAMPVAEESESVPGPIQQSQTLDLESLIGPDGLPARYRGLVEGLNIVQLNVLDLNGTTAWSTDPSTIGITKRESDFFNSAAAGEPASKLVTQHEVVHLDGVTRTIDVVESYLPLRKTQGGEIIGVMELYRDLEDDVTLQIEDTRISVLRTTVASMAGLFLVLLGFMVLADMTIYRYRRREIAVVTEANRNLEDQVQQRTRELEEAQQRQVHTERLAMIGQLAGGIAHDLRSPLGAISNAVYYLKRKLAAGALGPSDARVAEFLEIIQDEVQHSNQTITDLAEFAQQTPARITPTKLIEVINDALAAVKTKENVKVVTNFDSESLSVMADSEELKRVFINLAENAQDAMPNGGELAINLHLADQFAEVEISDTGLGISDENVAKVFDPLFTTKTKGTGLGLAVCHKIIVQHGGTIGVTSKSGTGTTFTVKLPLSVVRPTEVVAPAGDLFDRSMN